MDARAGEGKERPTKDIFLEERSYQSAGNSGTHAEYELWHNAGGGYAADEGSLLDY